MGNGSAKPSTKDAQPPPPRAPNTSGSPFFRGRTVVVFLDGTGEADAAFDRAVEWLMNRATDGRIVEVHGSHRPGVTPDPPAALHLVSVVELVQFAEVLDYGALARANRSAVQTSRLLVSRYSKLAIDAFRRRAAAVAVIGSVLVSEERSDAPKHTAAKWINQTHADHVFVGTRGLSGLAGWWAGSFSEYLLHNTDANIHIVKVPPTMQVPKKEEPPLPRSTTPEYVYSAY